MQITDYITLAEYAARNKVTSCAVRRKCLRGTLPGAVKMGRDWFIPADAPYPDNRVKSGQYVGWRDKSPRP